MASCAGSKGGISKYFQEKLIEITIEKARGKKKSVVIIDKVKAENK